MSAKCQWCRRKRPEVVVEFDGRELNVCHNCRGVIMAQKQRARDEAENAKNRAARHGDVAQ